MSTDQDIDFFAPRLSETGIKNIRKYISAAAWVLILGLCVSVINLTISVLQLVSTQIDFSGFENPYSLYIKMMPYIGLTYTVIFIVQLYYYYKTRESLTESILSKNEAAFNQSFHALFKNALWGVFAMFSACVINGIELYFLIKFYN